MSRSLPELNLVFNASGGEPLVWESWWKGAPAAENPDLLNVPHTKLRLRALAIALILAKYQEALPTPETEIVGEKPRITFQPEFDKGTWLYLLGSVRDLPEWISDRFKIEADEVFLGAKRGSADNSEGTAKPSVWFFPTVLPLANLHLWSRAKSHPKQELLGKELIKFALVLEERFENKTVKTIRSELFDAQGNWLAPGKLKTHLTGEANIVAQFLHNLAEKGLAKSMLFPPIRFNGKSLRDFCTEPQFLAQSEWEHLHQPVSSGEVSEPTQVNRRPQGDLLGKVLGDERFPARHTRVVLRGDPGVGKSTALWFHVGNQCSALITKLNCGEIGIDSSEFKVPLVLPLSSAMQGNGDLSSQAIEKVLQLVFGQDESIAVDTVRKWLRLKRKRAEYTLALDAMDELWLPVDTDKQTWLREQFRDVPENVPVLVTTRPNTIDTTLGLGNGQGPDGFGIYQLLPFEQAQIKRYVRAYFGGPSPKSETLLDHLRKSPEIIDLAHIPLLLAVLCHVYAENHPNTPLPSTRTRLINAALMALFEKGNKARLAKGNSSKRKAISLQAHNLSVQWKKFLLEEIAWSFWEAGPKPMRRCDLLMAITAILGKMKVSKDDSFGWAKLSAKFCDQVEFVEELCEDGVLVQFLASGEVHYSFTLRSFHELLVGGWLAREPKEKLKKRLLQYLATKGWIDPDWSYIWSLAAGQNVQIATLFFSGLDSPRFFENPTSAFLTFIASFVSESRCAAPSHWYELLMGSLKPTDEDALMTTLAVLDANKFTLECLDWLKNAKNLYAVQTPRGDLQDPKVVQAIARCATTEMQRVLTEDLKNEANTVIYRIGCAGVLGGIGNISSRDALISTLQTLTAVGNTENANLKNDLRFLRLRCVQGLRDVGDYESRDELLKYLRGTYAHSLRTDCANALAGMKDRETNSLLIEAIQAILRNESSTKMGYSNLGRVLCDIGSHESLGILYDRVVNPVGDPNGRIRIACVKALGLSTAAGTHAAIFAALQNEKDDPTGGIRFACAGFLGLLLKPESVPFLIARFRTSVDDEYGCVRAQCALRLGRIGGSACRAALIEFFTHPTTSDDLVAQIACVEALARLNHKEGWDAIFACPSIWTNDTDPTGLVRFQCALVLRISRDPAFGFILLRAMHFFCTSEDERGPLPLTSWSDVEEILTCLSIQSDPACRAALIHCALDPTVRWLRLRLECAKKLAPLDDSEWSNALAAHVRNISVHKDIELCMAGWNHLVKCRTAGSQDAIAALLTYIYNDDDGYRRIEWLQVLSEIEGEETRSALIAFLRAPGEEKYGLLSIACLRDLSHRFRDEVACAELANRLLNDNDDTTGRIRSECAEALGNIGRGESRFALIERLRMGSGQGLEEICRASAIALGKIGGDDSRDLLIKRLSDSVGDERGGIRAGCARGLKDFRDATSRQALIKRLLETKEDTNGWIRTECGMVLQSFNDRESREALRKCLVRRETPINVQLACIEALGSNNVT